MTILGTKKFLAMIQLMVAEGYEFVYDIQAPTREDTYIRKASNHKIKKKIPSSMPLSLTGPVRLEFLRWEKEHKAIYTPVLESDASDE